MLAACTQLPASRARLARVGRIHDTPPLSAGDLPECLPRTLAAVGLQTTTQGQMLIAPMAQSFTAPDPARAGGGKRIFPDIHAHDRTGCHRFCVVGFDHQIEKPATAAKHQFRFLRPTTLQHFSLVIPQDHRTNMRPCRVLSETASRMR
jgi:hypothetical protein